MYLHTHVGKGRCATKLVSSREEKIPSRGGFFRAWEARGGAASPTPKLPAGLLSAKLDVKSAHATQNSQMQKLDEA